MCRNCSLATPKDVVAKLADAVAKAVQSPDVASNLAGQGASPATMTSDQFAAYVKEEAVKWGKVVKDSGAKVE